MGMNLVAAILMLTLFFPESIKYNLSKGNFHQVNIDIAKIANINRY